MMLPVLAYLVVGIIAGVVTLKWPGARSEEPVGTLLFITVAWPMMIALLAIGAVFWALTALLALIGVEASQSDTHGV